MNEKLSKKEAELKRILGNFSTVAVALSGGVDSTLLLDVAKEVLGSDALAITACMASLPERELLATSAFCEKRGIRHLKVAFDEFSIPGFADNPNNRCYLCKKALLSTLLATTESEQVSTLVEGSNLDDEHDYRPGSVAIAELAVTSPLCLAGFTKDDIRALSKERGLPTWDKPACACLATRVPYGTTLSPELLVRIDMAEQYILDSGLKQVRVRVHDELARIEVCEDEMTMLFDKKVRHSVTEYLQSLGFTYISLDLQGYRTGSMNRNLTSLS